MGSTENFAVYVCDSIREAGGVISCRKMFGEYAVYCDGKVVGLICDNQFYSKPTEASRTLLKDVAMGTPYPGAKPYFLVTDELENRRKISSLVRMTADVLPLPKAKPKKSQRKANRKPSSSPPQLDNTRKPNRKAPVPIKPKAQSRKAPSKRRKKEN